MKLCEIYLLLNDIRKERKLSQLDIAEFLNVEQAAVSMYENGKRGIPLDLLDNWLQMLNIDITITPKDYEPQKSIEETKTELDVFDQMKKRRNFLIAEMRTMVAQRIVQEPLFQAKDDESGEGHFWPYSLIGDTAIGLIETRYDHPLQKYMAVEYTKSEINVYKFMRDTENNENGLSLNRFYFSEEDFLMLCDDLDDENMNVRKITIMRKNTKLPDGVEIIETEGFPLSALLQMQETYNRFNAVVNEIEEQWNYVKMENELEEIGNKMLDIVMDNRLSNGTVNPEFIFWSDEDKEAIDIPLWSAERNWYWIEDGIKWREEDTDKNSYESESITLSYLQ